MQATLPLAIEAEIHAVEQRIKAEPTAAKWRLGLFQRLCQAGDWKRAANQLETYSKLSSEQGEGGQAREFVSTYAMAIEQEQVRERVFAGKDSPQLPEGADEWLHMLASTLKAPNAPSDSDTSPPPGGLSVCDLRAQAIELAPAWAGTMDDRPFEWIADADSRLGPVCEVILNGAYQWLPFDLIELIEVAQPKNACDLVWLCARIKTLGGHKQAALLPARYPLGQAVLLDAHLRCALTTWEEGDGECWIGHGTKILATDNQEKSLLDVREIRFSPA